MATAIVALVIDDAFDCVWHASLVTKLHAICMKDALMPPIREYLSDRYLRGIIDGRKSEYESMKAGIPLAPTSYINKLRRIAPLDYM